MEDLIERKDAIKAVEEWAVNLGNPKMIVREDAILALKDIPSAENKGEWKVIGYDPLDIKFKCNTCGLKCNLATPYCPECGTKMKIGGKNV